jgi:hypothetical protein
VSRVRQIEQMRGAGDDGRQEKMAAVSGLSDGIGALTTKRTPSPERRPCSKSFGPPTERALAGNAWPKHLIVRRPAAAQLVKSRLG